MQLRAGSQGKPGPTQGEAEHVTQGSHQPEHRTRRPEKVTVAFLVAVGAAESGHPTLMFLVKKAVRLATEGTPVGVACEGCPPLADRVKRYEAAGGRYYVCPICFTAKKLSPESLIGGAELQGTVPLWEWIGDDDATTTTTFSDDLARQRYALARPRTSRMTEDILRANRCLAAAARHAVGVWRMPPLSSWPRPGPPRGPGRVAVWTLAEQQVGESLAGQVVPT